MSTGQEEKDLATLVGQGVVVLDGGERVTVRGITFLQGLQLAAVVRPVIDDMDQVFAAEEVSMADLQEVFARNQDAMVGLMAAATDLAPERIRALGDREGQTLLANFWAVNRDFFIDRLVAKKLAKHQPAAREMRSPSPKSSPP